MQLLERLKDYAAVHHRDHWVQVSRGRRYTFVGQLRLETGCNAGGSKGQDGGGRGWGL
jgi:hypothetical protein